MATFAHRGKITASQCRSARTLLSWSVSKLARTASISECDLDNFELERCKPHPATRDAIRRALEAAGAEFLPEDDVRVRPCTVGGPPIAGKSEPSAPGRQPQRRSRCSARRSQLAASRNSSLRRSSPAISR
jgi:transcriptional regulator with XRE-family HTH domain